MWTAPGSNRRTSLIAAWPHPETAPARSNDVRIGTQTARQLLGVLALAAALVWPAGAAGEETPYVGWTNLLPGIAVENPSRTPECASGQLQCVDKTIRIMTRQLELLASSCDHDAVFALAYLRVTEEVKRTVTLDPAFFARPSFVNTEVAVFAALYFDAYDAWKAGASTAVPGAWRVALDTAAKREASASGNLLLGINAHVQRDLPFALYELGFGRRADHNRVNEILNRVTAPLIAEIARRFDSSADDADLPTQFDDMTLFQLIASWRELAWRHAEALAAAPTAEARALVAQQIEEHATQQALAIKLATGYPPLLGGSATRDAFCAAHHDDA